MQVILFEIGNRLPYTVDYYYKIKLTGWSGGCYECKIFEVK